MTHAPNPDDAGSPARDAGDSGFPATRIDPQEEAAASGFPNTRIEPGHDVEPDWWSESTDGQCSENAALFAASQPAPLTVV